MGDFVFYAYKAVSFIVLPPGILVLALALGIALIASANRRASSDRERARRAAAMRAGIVLSIAGTAAFFALSLGPVADALLVPLEDAYPAVSTRWVEDAAERGGLQAVVVLGGGMVRRSPNANLGAAPRPVSLTRLFAGLSVARASGLPLVISGGDPYSTGETEAGSSARFISSAAEGVTILAESGSRNTAENASKVAEAFGFSRILLVTSAAHMPRAMAEFRKAGVQATPFPCDYQAFRGSFGLQDLFPDASNFGLSCAAIREYVGLIAAGDR